MQKALHSSSPPHFGPTAQPVLKPQSANQETLATAHPTSCDGSHTPPSQGRLQPSSKQGVTRDFAKKCLEPWRRAHSRQAANIAENKTLGLVNRSPTLRSCVGTVGPSRFVNLKQCTTHLYC
jgi:hypothetical protein